MGRPRERVHERHKFPLSPGRLVGFRLEMHVTEDDSPSADAKAALARIGPSIVPGSDDRDDVCLVAESSQPLGAMLPIALRKD